MVKNIIFDMGGVIIQWDAKKIAQMWNLSEEDRQLLLFKVFLDYRWPLLDCGYYSTDDDFIADLLPELPEHLRDVASEMVKDWRSRFPLNIEGMPELVRELKSKGYNLYLLSNAGPSHKDYWPYVESSECFDGVVVSCYEKQYKPCKDIFQTLLSRYKLNPSECIFIDDLNSNCAAAFLCGIQPIVFRNCAQLREDLKRFL